jgi:amino acid adenylation domain-containing protein/non-ribosomal peptide synthase protein (TIGR01720 family)
MIDPGAQGPSLSTKKQQLLELLLREKRAAAEGKEIAPRAVSRRPRISVAPLSFAQQRLWFLDRAQPGSPAYNIATAFRLRGPLQAALAQRTMEELVRRHEVFRTRFSSLDEEPRQVISPDPPPVWKEFDLSTLAAESREAELERLVNQQARRGFDLDRGPLLRVVLFRLGESGHVLLFVVHHIVCDGWSISRLFGEFEACYSALVAGRPLPPPEQRLQYADFAQWQREQVRDDSFDQHLQYWRTALAGAPQVSCPLPDRPRRAIRTSNGGRVELILTDVLTDSLRVLAERSDTTLFVLLLAAFQSLLYRWTGQQDLVVGTPVSGRENTELEDVIGLFANVVPIRTRFDNNLTFLQLLGAVREQVLDAHSHQDLPFEKLVEELRFDRSLQYQPLFQVTFAVHSGFRASLSLPSIESTLMPVYSGSAKFDLNLEILNAEGCLRCTLEYNADLFEASTATRLVQHYCTLLESLAENPECCISQLALITPGEREQLLVRWNDTKVECEQQGSLQERFERQVTEGPERLAVACRRHSLSYGELNRRANQWARRLQSLGVGREVVVAICAEPSTDMLVAILAVVKAGGAYLPLDPDSPAQRLAFLLEDSEARLVLTQEHLRERLPGQVKQLYLDDAAREQEQQDGGNLGIRSAHNDLAYVIYTSGSTGQPKGVAIEHRGLLNLVNWHQNTYKVRAEDRATLVANPSFDASVWETWPYLTAGASLHIVDEETRREPAALLRWLAEQRVTISFLPTPLAEAVLAEELPPELALRFLLTGGDRLHRLPQHPLPFELINHYGPTENAVVTTSGVVDPLSEEETAPAIGRPVANTRVYIVDPQTLQPVPVGAAGELLVGGEGLARGYYRRADLTVEKFITQAVGGGVSERLYRTGDLARYRSSGEIEFLGRLDQQVKVRGYRIELGEIETVLRRHPAVQEAVVLARPEPSGSQRLIAFVVGNPGQPPASREVSSYLAEQLPDYMVPGTILMLDALPLTPNGKLDRQTLLDLPERAKLEEEDAAAATELEKQVAAIWKEVLGCEQVGRDDNFFDLGGHSLLIARVQSYLAEELGRKLPIVELFQHPTVRALARHLSCEPEPSAPSARTPSSDSISDSLRQPIAIIGMSGRFAGARNLDEFWKNLCGGVESIRPFTDDELIAAGVSRGELEDPEYVKAGSILEDADKFDAGFFGMTPREAEITDPQQRIFLECAHEALETSGYDPETYEQRIGVFAGATVSTYWDNHVRGNPAVDGRVAPLQALIGNDKDFLSTRVSYKLNLKGPSVTVQTACSTSLVAVHMACKALRDGECEMALAGGVSIHFPQLSGYRFQEQGIASPDGHCRAFDAAARGTVAGNGAGVVLLKPLARAMHDGDAIDAVILGSAINNDGALKVGYTAPSVEGQSLAIEAALAAARVDPSEISYVEAHGTATPLGDPIEVAALSKVFGRGAKRNKTCAIGSVKTNLGHLDAAAGVAGLIKTVLQLKHKKITPSLHFQKPNPEIPFHETPFFVNTELRDWGIEGARRRAGVSSFGIGGTNAHVVLEEAPQPPSASDPQAWQLLTLSAKTSAALDAAGRNLADFLQSQPVDSLADVAYTLHVGRTAHRHRRVVLARDTAEAARALEGSVPASVWSSTTEGEGPAVAFLFSGQGSQYPDMGKDLYELEPSFRADVDHCVSILRPHLDRDLRELIFPGEEPPEQAAESLRQTAYAQPALFAIEYAVARFWMRWGIRPAAMVGHSLGEYVAAHFAGVLSLEDALHLVVTRGRLMQSLPRGAMLSVRLGESEIRQRLGRDLSIAALNAPNSCVVSGSFEAIKELRTRLQAEGIEGRLLETSHAFHSAMMDPVLPLFGAHLENVSFKEPALRYISNQTGTWITSAQATDPGYWLRHMRETVRFSDGLAALSEMGGLRLLEVGPGNALASLARKHGRLIDASQVLRSLPHPSEKIPASATMREALGRLWLSGCRVDWHTFHESERRRRVHLPTYPFERRRHWIDPVCSNGRAGIAAGRTSNIEDWFYAPSWERSPLAALRSSAAGAQPPLRWLVFLDGNGVAEQLCTGLEAEGHKVLRIFHGANFQPRENAGFEIRSGRKSDYHLLIQSLAADGGMPDRILHAWSISTPEMESDLTGFYSLLYLTQALLAHGHKPPALTIFTCGAQDVLGTECLRPAQSTILGLCKVLSLEHPEVHCRAIDLDPSQAKHWLDSSITLLLLRELASPPVSGFAAYRGVHRWTPGFQPIRIGALKETPRLLRQGGTYLIAGGLGGVGLAIARFLASELHANLVLIGRSASQSESRVVRQNGVTEGKAATQRELEALGAKVLTLGMDIADPGKAQDAVRKAKERFGALHGVFHAAGVQVPGSLKEISPSECDQQLRAKIQGTLALHQALADEPLDFCLLVSSLAAVLGAHGYAAYPSAHVFLDTFAHMRNRTNGTPWIAVDLDNWSTTKSVEFGSPGGAPRYGMNPEEGIEVIRRVLSAEPCFEHWIISSGNLESRLAGVDTSNLSAGEAWAEGEGTLLAHQRLSKGECTSQQTESERLLCKVWSNVLGIEPVGVHDNFFELGGDSVMSLQIVAQAKKAGLTITPKQLFEHQTIQELALASSAAAGVEADQGILTGEGQLAPIQSWFFEQRYAEPHYFNQAILLEIRRALEPSVVRRSWEQLVAHHDALRLRFERAGDRWKQFYSAGEPAAPFGVSDLSAVADADLGRAIEAECAAAHSRLNLERGPIARALLFDCGPRRAARLFLVIHHLATDLVSWRFLLEDLNTLCRQYEQGKATASLPAKTTSFQAWSGRLAEAANSGLFRAEIPFWKSLSNDSGAPLPTDFPTFPGSTTEADAQVVSRSLTAGDTESLLRHVPLAHKTQVNEILLTALARAVRHWTGHQRLLVELEGTGRDASMANVDLSRTVGWFTSLYPIALQLTSDGDWNDDLRAIQRQLKEVPNGGVGFGALRYLSADRQLRQELQSLPHPQIVFLYEGRSSVVSDTDTFFSMAAESSGPPHSPRTELSHLLAIRAGVQSGCLQIDCAYSSRVFLRDTVRNLADSMIQELHSFLQQFTAVSQGRREADAGADFSWDDEALATIVSAIDETLGAR